MKPKLNFVNNAISQIKKDNLYRFLHHSRIDGEYIVIKKKRLLNLCSNDYLGMPVTKLSTSQMESSSRLVSGNDQSYSVLEKKLSKHKSQNSALIFPTGYMANLGAISTIIGKKDVILSDELNHASIIESIRLARAKTIVYKHNDIDDLEKKLKQKHRHKFIITEGVFSMDGDFAKLKQIAEMAAKSNAVLILDDAHGDFVVGDDGKGTAQRFGISKKIDLYISSLSKGLGSFGGYIATHKNIVDFCINKSKAFIYTSALPSVLVEHALKRFLSKRENYRKKLEKNVELFSESLKQLGYEINSSTHIIPIILGSEKTTIEFGKFLFDKGLFVQPIRYPTVQRKKARIRISVTSRLSKRQIFHAVDIFEKAGKKFNVL